jgi:hypothetical protein
MGDAALGMLATRMTVLNGMASSRIRKITAELRADRSDTDEKSECAHREWYRNLGLRRPTRSWTLGAPRPAAMMKSSGYEGQSMQIKPSPARAAVPI